MRALILTLCLAACSPAPPALDEPTPDASLVTAYATRSSCNPGYRLEPIFPSQAEPATCVPADQSAPATPGPPPLPRAATPAPDRGPRVVPLDRAPGAP